MGGAVHTTEHRRGPTRATNHLQPGAECAPNTSRPCSCYGDSSRRDWSQPKGRVCRGQRKHYHFPQVTGASLCTGSVLRQILPQISSPAALSAAAQTPDTPGHWPLTPPLHCPFSLTAHRKTQAGRRQSGQNRVRAPTASEVTHTQACPDQSRKTISHNS